MAKSRTQGLKHFASLCAPLPGAPILPRVDAPVVGNGELPGSKSAAGPPSQLIFGRDLRERKTLHRAREGMGVVIQRNGTCEKERSKWSLPDR